MKLVRFPFERVVDINEQILKTEAGFKAVPDLSKLQGALARIDNAIWYEGLDDVFDIAAKYASSISASHAFSDANKRTALAVAIEFLSLNDFTCWRQWAFGKRRKDLVIGELTDSDFADILYAHYRRLPLIALESCCQNSISDFLLGQ